MKTKTMSSECNKDTLLAIDLLENTGISLVEAAQLVKDILDAKPKKLKLGSLDYCSRIASIGVIHFYLKDMSIGEGLELYLKEKASLSPSSLKDMKYLSRCLFRNSPDLPAKNFSALGVSECEKILLETFKTVPQFNKARTFLYGLFEYALSQDWLCRNIINQIKRLRQ